jgi:hypothetical protein
VPTYEGGEGVRRNLILTVALGVMLAATVALSSSRANTVTTCELSLGGCSPFTAEGGLTPKALPQYAKVPVIIKLEVGSSVNDRQPPALEEVTIEFSKSGTIDVKGLPACRRNQLEALDAEAARSVCRKSILGTGTTSVSIPSLQPDPIQLPLTLFNGGARTGTPMLFIQSSIPGLTPAAIVAPVKVSKASARGYGLQAVTRIPPIDGGSGSLLDFSLKINRTFNYLGTKQGFATASCPHGQLFAHVSYTFGNDGVGSGELAKPCNPSG